MVSTLLEVFYIYIYRHTLAEAPAGDSAKQPERFAQIRYTALEYGIEGELIDVTRFLNVVFA